MSPPRRHRRVSKPKDAHERALGLLAVRPRSRREIRDRLLRAGFGAEEVEDVIARLERVDLLDDERFAREFAQHAVGVKGVGRRSLVSGLLAKGIARDTIDEIVGEFAEDQESRAEALAKTRLGRLASLERPAAYRRLTEFLIRKGYDASVARQAAGRALAVDGAGAEG